MICYTWRLFPLFLFTLRLPVHHPLCMVCKLGSICLPPRHRLELARHRHKGIEIVHHQCDTQTQAHSGEARQPKANLVAPAILDKALNKFPLAIVSLWRAQLFLVALRAAVIDSAQLLRGGKTKLH